MENKDKILLTFSNMLQYQLQLHTTQNFHPNSKAKPLLKGATATLTGDLYADIENQTFGSNPFRPALHSMEKLIEQVLPGGLIPIVELYKIRTQHLTDSIDKYYLGENQTAVLKLEGNTMPNEDFAYCHFFEIDFDNDNVMFSLATERYKIGVEGIWQEDFGFIGNEFAMLEKLKEWHFNIFNLPKSSYIEKSELCPEETPE